MKINGKAWIFGDDVDTDAIIPARYLNTSDPKELARHCMEDIDEGFSRKVSPGDVIVAGRNFGCGSSREHAPIAIKHAGIAAVIAGSFARIFYRNAFNMGLPILETGNAIGDIREGDEIGIDLEIGIVFNKTRNQTYQARPTPPFMQDLIKAGGLIPYVRKRIKL